MRRLLAAAALFAATAPVFGQEIHWQNEFLFYLDNTEFFTPYRSGETILGTWFKTYLELSTGGSTHVRAGVFGDHRSGDTKFLDPVKPILSFRWQTDQSVAVLGTLEPRDRHGYLEPIEVTTLEFTRPIEYGLQWVENQKRVHSDACLNWQYLNTKTSREIFDTGFVGWWNFSRFARLEGQLRWFHHGGQLHDVGPVSNNVVGGPGLRFEEELQGLGHPSFAAFYLASNGPVDMNQKGRIIPGHGVYLRASAEPWGWLELALIFWRGHNFITQEGDHNYGSFGEAPGFYRVNRRYEELAAIKKLRIAKTIELDAEYRLHRIDGKFEYSYRLAVRAPFDVKLR